MHKRGSYIKRNDGDAKDDNPDRHIQVGPPVGDEDTGHRQVIRQNDYIFKEVVPSCGETTGSFVVSSAIMGAISRDK